MAASSRSSSSSCCWSGSSRRWPKARRLRCRRASFRSSPASRRRSSRPRPTTRPTGSASAPALGLRHRPAPASAAVLHDDLHARLLERRSHAESCTRSLRPCSMAFAHASQAARTICSDSARSAGAPSSHALSASRTRSRNRRRPGTRRSSGCGATANTRAASTAMSSSRSTSPTMRSRMCSSNGSGSRGPSATALKPLEPVVDRATAPLDEAVRVQDEDAARGQLDDVL